MADLSVNIGELQMKNPVMTASGMVMTEYFLNNRKKG